MSGGFFRGTSTDQDTRFSNKKAKLLKSQKFAPELETLVDMTKVKMDVMRPWIAKRVTELIGFEDEVLINFIYGLLEGKEVNGKEVQISLTGFMERNTGKFMKELWLLLLSAQQNLSGVPQQFLDAKEEETKKKKAETDRIANEIHKKREKERQELEQEKTNMDGVGEMLRDKHGEVELNLKPDPRLSSMQPADEEEQTERKHLRGRSRVSRSPDLAYRASSPRQKHSTPPVKSFSNSRSYSNERQRSRSISKSPLLRSRSNSSERRYSTSPRRSLTPYRRYVWHSPSQLRHRSSHSKRRSPSPTRYRVRSPWRRRSRSPRRWSRSPVRTSPVRRRSPSPMRRRSPSPVRRRSPSPVRRRSLSSMRGRSPSPARHRSPSPLSRRSPSPRYRPSPPPRYRLSSPPRHRMSPPPRHRMSPSPRHRRSPSPWRRRPQTLRRHSPSPVRRRYQRSPSATQQRSLSPVRRSSSMLGRKRSLTPALRRSPSPQESSSRSPIRNSSFSPVRKRSPRSTRSPPHSPEERVRSHEKHSRTRSVSPGERAEDSAKSHRGSKPVDRKPIMSLRSPQRDMLDRNDSRVKEPASSLSMQKSPFVSVASRERGYSEDRRSSSPHGSLHQRRERLTRPESPSPILKTSVPKPCRDSSGTSADDENFSTREVGEYKYRSSGKVSPTSDRRKDFIESAKVHVLDEASKSRKSQLTNSEKLYDRVNHKEREKQELSVTPKTTSRSEKERESNVDEGDRTSDKNNAQADGSKEAYQVQEPEVLPKLLRKSERNGRNGSLDSPSKENDEHKTKVKEKRKHKKLDRHELESDDYSSYDSYEERKETKRRRKEEKRLKKEERRRRRDDRRRRKEERRAEKRKLKSTNAGSPSSDLERVHSEDESYRRQESRSDNQEAKSEQKNLEIALREKALESLRAKKGIGN